MKKLLLIGLMLALVVTIFADIQMPNSNSKKIAVDGLSTTKHIAQSRITPQYEFTIAPTTVGPTFYDYMFGAYDGTPLATQNVGNGLYGSFMSKSTSSATRKANMFYIAEDGSVVTNNAITTQTVNEGFVTVAVDQPTGNPFFVWHSQYTGLTQLGVHIAYDQYSLLNSPGNAAPYTTIMTSTDANWTYIWPVVQVGPSPTAGMRRVYVFASNSGQRVHGNPSSTVKLAYADFNDDTFSGEALALQWTYQEFPYLTAIHNNVASARAFPSYQVKDNYVVIGGFVLCDSGLADENGTELWPPHNMFYLVSNNYGETFETHTMSSKRQITAPLDENGVVYEAYQAYTDWEVTDASCNHKSMYIDEDLNTHFVGNYSVNMNDETGAAKWFHKGQYVKDVKYNLTTNTLNVYDMWPTQPTVALASDNLLMIPWDADENGQTDEFDADGLFVYDEQIPMMWWEDADWFHYNYFRNTRPNSEGWMAALWQDCTKSFYFNSDGDDAYAQYATVPEIKMCFSADKGATWSDAITMNALTTPEFADMIPSFFYLGDEIKVSADDAEYGLVNILFLDDNTYGSSIQSDGTADGGTVKYAQIKVNFGALGSNDIAPVKPTRLSQNYPNPFNPNTNIKFNMPVTENVNISIYNVKGQLVKTLVNGVAQAGSHTITWNGVDNNNTSVSSGVYFYKLESANHKEMKKMMLIK